MTDKDKPQTNTDNASVTMTGNLVSRGKLASMLGKQYGTDRDIYEALGYPTSIAYDDYAVRYARQDVAAAVIDRPVDATWTGGFTLVESDDDEETDFEKAWSELAEVMKINSQFLRSDRLTGLGMYGVLLLGLSDVQKKEDWANPVETNGEKKLIYIKPFGEGSAEIDTYIKDTSDPKFGSPEFYKVKISQGEDKSVIDLKVHHTRILHFADNILEDEILGIPRMQAVFNRLMDLEKLMGGSAEMFWRGARPGYKGKIDDGFTMTTEGKEALESQLNEYEHNLRRFLINEGIDLEALSMEVASPKDHVDIQLQAISAKTGIPKRLLVGSEMGELASSQDRDNWFDTIGSRRQNFAEPVVIRPFVDRCILYGILPEPKEKYTVNWSPLYEKSDKEQAEIGKIRATSLKEYATNPQAEMTVPPLAFFKFFLGLKDDEIEMIEEMQEAAINEEEEDLGLETEEE